MSCSSSCLVQCDDTGTKSVATAHLFNFVGDGLKQARQSLIAGGVPLPLWNVDMLEQHLSLEKRGRVHND